MIENDSTTSVPAGDKKDAKVIKRYSNRKLYDTVESRYVTLDEIARMIQEGAEVRIVDNRSKEDLTSVTLAQIIFEQEKKKSRMSLAVLKDIIRHPGEVIAEFVQKEVAPRVTSLKDEVEQRVGSLKELPSRIVRREGEGERPGVKDMVAASQRALDEFQKKIDERIKAVIETMASIPSLSRDLGKLAAKIDEIEKKVDKLSK